MLDLRLGDDDDTASSFLDSTRLSIESYMGGWVNTQKQWRLGLLP